MKYLVSVLLVFICLSSFAQEPIYTPMRGNYKFKGIKVDTLLLIPSFSDTTAANSTYLDQVAGAMIRTGNDFWMRNANSTSWLQNVNVGNGASPVMNFVNEVFKKYGTDSVFYIVAPHDTFFAFQDLGVDTTSLSDRIDNKIDSIYRKQDSVFFKKNGYWNFAFLDSLGQSKNFANTNLRATGNRTHSFANYNLTIDSVGVYDLISNGGTKYGGQTIVYGEGGLYSTDAIDGSKGIVEAKKDSSFIGTYKTGEYIGLITNGDTRNTYFKRGSNRAYLSMKNFGTDTIALKSDITGGTDSPDRINGSATENVKANMNDFNLIFDNVDTFLLINTNKSIILTDERITIDNYSHATTKTKGDLQFTQSRQIDLSSVSDTIYIPGTYVITNSGQPLYFKEPSRLPGQIIHVINRTGNPVDIYSLSGEIKDQTGGVPANIQTDKFAILSSDGYDWWIFNAN